MNIRVAGDMYRSAEAAIKAAVDWWASASGTQKPIYPWLQPEDEECIRSAITVLPEPGEDEEAIVAYEAALRRRAVEHARELVQRGDG